MTLSSDETNFLQRVFDEFEADPKKLNDWEQGFMTNNKDRFSDYGQDIRLSDKQWKVIKDVAEIYDVEVIETIDDDPPDKEFEVDTQKDDEIPF